MSLTLSSRALQERKTPKCCVSSVSMPFSPSSRNVLRHCLPLVRETLSADLTERLIADIIEITESMMCMFRGFLTHSPADNTVVVGAGSKVLLAISKTLHLPEREHAR